MPPLSITPSHPHMATAMVASLLLAMLLPATANAQQEAHADRTVAAVEATAPTATTAQGEGTASPSIQVQAARRIDIGAATGQLLAMQRSSQGLRPRPIDGEQAGRSYQRYLKSFETTIPEHYETGIDAGSGGSK